MKQARLRIETGFMFWELDYVAMDFSPAIPLDVKHIVPSHAINEEGKDVKKLIAAADKKYYIQPVSFLLEINTEKT